MVYIFSKMAFNNWRKALEKFQNHARCHARGEVFLKWQMLQIAPVSEQLNSQMKKEQDIRRQGKSATAATNVVYLRLWLEKVVEEKQVFKFIINELITIMDLNVL